MRSGSETASTPTSTVTDPRLSMIRRVYPRTPNGCEECLVLGLMEITLAIKARSARRRIEDRALHPV